MAIGKISRPIRDELPETEQEFIAKSENYVPLAGNPFDSVMLKGLSLDELVSRYHDIDYQSQLFKGQILLEARERFKSNQEFGEWRSVNFTEQNSSNIGKLINLAKFFDNTRSLDGIPVSAGYLLAAPSNKEIAEKVYDEIKTKNLKLNEIKSIINRYSTSKKSAAVPEEKDTNLDLNEVRSFATKLLETAFEEKQSYFIKAVLKEVLRQLK